MSKSKNDIFYLIVLILTIITLMVGITFTYFSLVAKEKDDSTKVKTGSIAINYIDGASINSNGLIPRKEPSLGENYAVYTCLLYTSPSPRDVEESRMPSSA